jgi:hypothetical protein
MSKILIAAAALLVSTGASAQSHGNRSADATPRHAVLDNIIGRVQMDALIDTVIDTDVAPVRVAAKPARARRDVDYADVKPMAVRTRG